METTISQFSNLPQTKQEREMFVQLVVNEILSGSRDPLEVEIYLKNIEETINEIRKNSEVKQLLIREASKYNSKTFDFNGSKITISQRSTYDYSTCNSSEWSELDCQIKELKEKQKVIEKQLSVMTKSIVDAETGELINPPVKSTTEFLTIKLK